MNRARRHAAHVALLSLLGLPHAQAATITLVPGAGFSDATGVLPEGGNSGTTLGQQRTILFNAAAAIWAGKLTSSQTIKIEASFAALPCTASQGVLGSAGADSFVTLGNGADERFFPIALAESITGNNLNGSDNEIVATFNATIDQNNASCLGNTRWYYGLTGPAPNGTIAVFPTLLHELGHGLGFLTLVCSTPGGCTETSPTTPNGGYFFGIPDIWSEFLRDNSGANTYWVDMSDAQRVASFTDDPLLVWDGPALNARIAALGLGGSQVNESRLRMYAPATFEPGSSLSHFTVDATPNLLMEPSLTDDLFGDTDLTDCLFDDIGWVQSGCASDTNTAPTLNAARSPALTAVLEDAPAPVGAVGTLVSALVDFASPSGQVDNVTDPDAGALLGIAVTASAASGTWSFSTDGGSNWSALGNVSASNARLLAADANTRLHFQPGADFNGSISSAITFRAWDRTSGSAGALVGTTPNGGSTALSSTTDTASIVVTAVNDAPTLLASASPVFAPIGEDAPTPSGAVGTLVSALVDFASPAGQLDNVSDPDAGASLGIAIIAADDMDGTWFFSVNGSTWTALNPVTSSTARLLLANGTSRLYFRPDADFEGDTPTIGFRAWDQTTGSNGATANISAVGATTAFSSASDTAPVTVVSINDAPVLDAGASPLLASVLEDAPVPVGAVGTLVSALVDFATPAGQLDNITDADADALLGIAVIAGSVNGSVFFSVDNGNNWLALGTVGSTSARLLAANATTRVYFRPNADFAGSTPALTFHAWDRSTGTNGAIANATLGGSSGAYSASTDSVAIAIVGVNDAPTLDAIADPADVSVDAGQQTVPLTGIGAGGGETQTLVVGAVSSNPSLIPNPSVVYTSPNSSGSVRYTPAAGITGTATISVTVTDGGGTANGGVNATTRTFEVEIVGETADIFGDGFEGPP